MSVHVFPRRHWTTIAVGRTVCRSQDFPLFDSPRSAMCVRRPMSLASVSSSSPRSTYESARTSLDTPKTSDVRFFATLPRVYDVPFLGAPRPSTSRALPRGLQVPQCEAEPLGRMRVPHAALVTAGVDPEDVRHARGAELGVELLVLLPEARIAAADVEGEEGGPPALVRPQ